MDSQVRAEAGITKTQSVAEPRRTYRLSKPRTNTSSTNLLLLSGDCSEESLEKSHLSAGTSTSIASPTEDLPGHSDARNKIMNHIFGNTSPVSRKSSSEDDNEDRTGLVEVARNVRDRLSRRSSVYIQPPSGRTSVKDLSAAYGGSWSTLDAENRMVDQENSQQVLEDIKQKALHDTIAALNHIPTPIDEDKHVDSVLSPIRRRSLLTPGIATRVPHDILRKQPLPERKQLQDDRDYYFNPTLSETSPLSRLAALDVVKHGRVSPVSRASTPSNLDYTHLGGLKLGTLRITNGTESSTLFDELETCSAQSSPDLGVKMDYHTIPVERSSENNEIIFRANETYHPSEELTDLVSSPGQANRQTGMIERVGRPRRHGSTTDRESGSPLKYQHYLPESSFDEESNWNRSRSSSSKKRRPLSSSAFSPKAQNRVSSIAEAYTSELLESPFGSPISKCTLDATEDEAPVKLAADGNTSASPTFPGFRNWKSFIDEAKRRYSGAGSREDAFRILNGSTACEAESCPGSRRTSSSSADEASLQSSIMKETPASSITKADSGYSSNTSLKSLVKQGFLANVTRPGLGRAIQRSSVASRSLSGPRKIADETPSTTCSKTENEKNNKNINTLRKARPVRSSLLIVQKPSAIDLICDSSLRSPSQTISITACTTSSASISQVSSSLRKLKKARPQSLPPPKRPNTVQSCRDLDNCNIPPVPSDIAARHADRLQKFPLLEHTFSIQQDTRSMTGTPSPELTFIPIRFPSPTNTDKISHTSTSDSEFTVSSQHIKSESLPRSRISINFSIKSKSERQISRQHPPEQHDVPSTIADFGTVIESLGKSPYDIARQPSIARLRANDNTKTTHPYQMSTDARRVKSMMGMDEATASEFARLRSKYRTQSPTRRRTPSFNNHGGIPGKMLRPGSLIVDVPPVPSLPAASIQHYRKEELKNVPRPRSLLIDTPAISSLRTRPSFNNRAWVLRD
ncbi:hypothetical protein MMC06_003087 [Schaereria dolodes]|nr:hypothetical protein [Schaereria dolodes]